MTWRRTSTWDPGLTSGSYAWAAITTSVYSAGSDQTIEVDITAAAGNFDSATVIPNGAVVKTVWVNVGTIYDGAATITVTANGGTPVTLQAAIDNNPASVNNYQTMPFSKLGVAGTGVVRVVLGGAPTVGAAKVFVTYCIPLA